LSWDLMLSSNMVFALVCILGESIGQDLILANRLSEESLMDKELTTLDLAYEVK